MTSTDGRSKIERLFVLTRDLSRYKEKDAHKFFVENFDSKSELESLKLVIEIREELNNELIRLKELNHPRANKYLQYISAAEGAYKLLVFHNSIKEWPSFNQRINGNVESKLEALADIVEGLNENLMPKSEDVMGVIDKIDDLIKEISADESYPPYLREFCYEQLEKMKSALLKFNFYGYDEIDLEIDAVLGSMIKNNRKLNPEGNSKVKDLLVKFGTVWTFANTVVSIGKGSVEMIEDVQGIIDKF